MFAAVQDTRRQWEALTDTTRRIAIAADLELRRRHPGEAIPPLRPDAAEAAGADWPGEAAPAAGPDTDEEAWVQLTLDGAAHPVGASDQRVNEQAQPRRREAAGQLALGLTPQTAQDPVPEQVTSIRDNTRAVQDKLDELAGVPLPAADDDSLSPGPAWPAEARRERDAVLQPPRPHVVPSSRVLARQQMTRMDAGHAEPEAG